MMETLVVVDTELRPIFWHEPNGRSSVSIPDTRDLWDVLWQSRDRLRGVAHSHPGSGVPCPSREDLTTFAAIEAALGARLTWWITSRDTLVELCWRGPDRFDYEAFDVPWRDEPGFVEALRFKSY